MLTPRRENNNIRKEIKDEKFLCKILANRPLV